MARRRSFGVYAAAAVLPLLILLVLPLESVLVSRLGQEISLAVRPVDPTDLFRGEYVALRFSAESADLGLFGGAEARRGSRWFAALEQGSGGLWAVSALSKKRPGGVYLEATVRSARGSAVELDFGENLSRFYVKEGSAATLSDAAAKGTLRARARVWRGRAALQALEAAQ